MTLTKNVAKQRGALSTTLTKHGEGAGEYDGTHIVFRWLDFSASGRTLLWHVNSKDGGDYLGLVGWHGPWRKYAFYPKAGTIFETTCLNEIAEFTALMTKAHRKS